jgi:hypothetical protein
MAILILEFRVQIPAAEKFLFCKYLFCPQQVSRQVNPFWPTHREICVGPSTNPKMEDENELWELGIRTQEGWGYNSKLVKIISHIHVK